MNILIVGLGSIGKKHVTTIKKVVPSAKIFALRSQKLSENHPAVTNIYTFNEIPTIKFDFAVIANPTSEHKKTLEQLIGYDIPLFIEKPLHSSLDIEDLVNAVIRRKIQTYVACNLRFLDCLKFIKVKLLEEKNHRLNEVNVYCGSFLPEWRPDSDFRKKYSAIAELGGGVHFDLIHELDYIYWLFGAPKEVKRYFKGQSSLSISAFDYANYIMDFDGFSVSVVLNYYRRDTKRCFELVFDDETWNVDLLKNEVNCNNQILYSSNQRITDTYQEQMEYFINCLRKNTITFNSISDGYKVLKICLEQ